MTDKPIPGGSGAARALNDIASIPMPSYQDQQSKHETNTHFFQQKTQHALYPREDWLLERENGDTALPYWDWVEMVRVQGLRGIQHASS